MINVLKRLFQRRDDSSSDHPAPSNLSAVSSFDYFTGYKEPLSYPVVYATINMLSSDIARLPLKVYRKTAKGREEIPHALTQLLRVAPNEYMTAYTMRQALISHVLSWGNGYLHIERNSTGQVRRLTLLLPDRTHRDFTEGKAPFYRTMSAAGSLHLSEGEIMHVVGLGFDGLRGYPVLLKMGDIIETGQIAEKFASSLLRNSGRPGGVLKYDRIPSGPEDEKITRFSSEWSRFHEGAGNAGRTAVLPAGFSYQEIGHPPESLQLLETRKYQKREWAMVLRVPLHMLQDLERSTFNNIAEQSIEYVQYALAPIIQNIESAMNWKLLTERERKQGFYIEHSIEGLLRGNSEARAQYYHTLLNDGVLSANEVREKENMNPQAGGVGDAYYIPLNMVKKGATTLEVEKRQMATPEIRSSEEESGDASIRIRRSIGESYTQKLQEAAEKIAEEDKRALFEALFGEDGEVRSDWKPALHDLYPEIAKTLRKLLFPVLDDFSKEVMRVTAADIAIDPASIEDEFQKFVVSYVETQIYRFIDRGQKVVTKSIDETALPNAEELKKVVDDLEEVRVKDFPREQTTQVRNAVTRQVMLHSQYQYVEVVTHGENCPYCDKLSGRKYSLYEPILSSGQEIYGEGVQPMKITRNYRHPPFHRGCDCDLRYIN